MPMREKAFSRPVVRHFNVACAKQRRCARSWCDVAAGGDQLEKTRHPRIRR